MEEHENTTRKRSKKDKAYELGGRKEKGRKRNRRRKRERIS